MADQESKRKETESSGYNHPTASLASTPKKRHRRMTDGDVPSTLSSASSSPMINSEPVSSSSSHASTSTLTSPSTYSSPKAATPRAPRFPVRIGITWKKGEKLEAMDFSHTWYPSKIVEIDGPAKHVLIHFEGWNQRYDEWVPMESEKLRPVTRHSERKDKGVKRRRIHPHPIYRAGEQVLAKWTDCKKYPAKISRLKEDGMYEIIFYDGVTRLIQPMNIQPLPESMRDLRTLPPDMSLAPRIKPSFKQIKVTLPESVKRAKEKLERSRLSSEGPVLDKNKVPEKSPVLYDKDKEPSGSLVLGTKNMLPGRSSQSTKRRILHKRKFHSKKSGHTSSRNMLLPGLDRDQRVGTVRLSRRRPYSWKIRKFKKCPTELPHSETNQTLQAESTEEPELTAVAAIPATPTSSPAFTVAPARKSVSVKESIGPDSSHVEIVAAAIDQAPSCSHQEAQTLLPKRTKKRSNTVPHLLPKHKKVRSKSKDGVRRPGRPPLLIQTDRAQSLDALSSTVSSPVQTPLPMPVFIPSKAFIVEEDHNPFKCHHQGCNKDFRKDSLLAYHLKYYHTEVEASPHTMAAASLSGYDRAAGVTSPLMTPTSLQSPGGTPVSRKRRKKTSSICSTDSDVSISSKGRGSNKRRHHDSEVSIAAATSPDVLNRDPWMDMKPSHATLDSVSEEFVAVDTEDEEMDADVVNCICGQRETNGLMIQCDVCMCWQHFACVDTSISGVPPTNYVCNVCEKTPGIRDSCRYMYDMGWERRGELPTFPFVTENSSEHLQSVATECNDMISTLLSIKSALHSTRKQIKISKEDDDPEFQLWQTDWDNWTKAEEDLTLTPRSGDPDPSPTPSTFLFPHAHCSSIATSTIETPSPAAPALSHHVLTSVSHPGSAIVPSSSQIPHFPTSSTKATTLQPASLVASASPLSQTAKLSYLTEALTSATVTSPSGTFQVGTLSPASSQTALPPLAPPVEHTSPLTSTQAQIKDPDRNPISDKSTNSFQPVTSGECLSSHSESSSHKSSSGHPSFVDQRPSTESNCKEASNLPLSQSTRQFHEASSASQLQDVSSVTPQSQGISSVTSQTQGISSVKLSESSSVDVGVSLQAKSSSQDLHNNGENSVTLSGQVTSGTERLVSSSNGQEDKFEKIASTTGTGTTAGDVDSRMNSLYVEVSGGQGLQVGCPDEDDDDDVPDNDTDTAEESLDPYRNCEHNLLVHVSRVHSDIEKQLEALEQQLTELENSEHTNPTVQLSEDNILNDVPALKKSLSKLHRNLVKVQKFCIHH